MIDLQSLPVSGGVVLAVALHAGAAWFVTGPLVGERTIARSDWGRTCTTALQVEIAARREPPRVIPRTDCSAILGGWMPELDRLCRDLGNPDLGGPAAQVMREQERLRLEAQERRIATAAARSGSRCACAAATFIEEERVALAIHAGTARLVTPPAIDHLHAGLTRRLHGTQCNLDVVGQEVVR